MTTVLLLSLLIGIVTGLRSLTAPAAVSWSAYVGRLNLAPTSLAFMGYLWTPWIFTVLAVVELITDQLPTTPSRTAPVGLGARIFSGALCGASIGASQGLLAGGLIAGVVGAIAGTFGGHAFRAWLAALFGNDRPAALIEDAIAILGAWLVVSSVR